MFVFVFVFLYLYICNQPHLRMTANMYKLCPLAFFFIHSFHLSIQLSIPPSIHSFIRSPIFIRLFSHPFFFSFFLFSLFSYQRVSQREAVAKPKAKCNEPRRAKNYCSFVVGTCNNTYSFKLKYTVDRNLSRGVLILPPSR